MDDSASPGRANIFKKIINFLKSSSHDEEMTEEEYLEMVASFYGAVAAKEVAGSFVKINLISKDGKKESLNYPLTQVFCGLTQ